MGSDGGGGVLLVIHIIISISIKAGVRHLRNDTVHTVPVTFLYSTTTLAHAVTNFIQAQNDRRITMNSVAREKYR